ncbi:MAG: PAS domain S-box protein [Mariprofundaceae bacterium]|nr:PAS domain S-box protein [Mariprofundaceae bacterium]
MSDKSKPAAKPTAKPTAKQFAAENDELRARLAEAEETLRAIRGGEVDALVLSAAEGDSIFELKGNQEPYRVMVEAMGEGALALARDGTILYSNRRFADCVKVPLGQVVGKSLKGMLADQDQDSFDAMLVQGAKAESCGALTLQATDGAQTPTLFSMSPLPQSEGKVISVIITDLSEVVAAAEVRSRLARIVESSDDAIVSATLNGVIESWNRAAEKLYGYTAGEAIGQSINALIVPPERTHEVIDELEASRKGKRSQVADTIRLRKDGTQIEVSVKASPILDDAGMVVGVSVNARDISERKRVEEERDRATCLLGERLKELGCLYAVSTILADSELSVEQTMRRIVETLPPAFQHPEVTCACLSLWGRQYRSGDCKQTPWRLASPIVLMGEEVGELLVRYTEERLASDEVPFLREEQDLVDTITHMVVDYLRLDQAMSQLQQFHDLLDASSDSVFVIDPATADILDINGRVCTSLGYSRDELLRMRVMEFAAMMSGLSAWNGHVQKSRKTGAVLVEDEFRRKDGSTFPVEVSVKYAPREGNDYIIAIARDITERKKAELALRKKESQLSEALTIARIGYWEYEFSTDEFIFNDQYYTLHNITAAEVGGYRMSSADFANRYVFPDDAAEIGRQIQLAFETRDPDYFAMVQTRLLTGDGEIVWVEVRFRVEKDSLGNTVRLIGVNQDITEREQSEEEVRASRDLLRSVVENIPLRVFWKDREIRYLGCNSLFAHDAGMKNPKELYGKDDFQMGWKDQAELYRADDKTVMDSGKAIIGYEEPQTTPDGQTIWLRTSKVPLRADDGEVTGLLGIYEDISEEKQAQETLRHLNRTLKTLSAGNHTLVHSATEEQLLSGICRVAVEEGGYLLTWIGYARDDEAKSVKVMASHAVKPGYTENIHVSWDDVPEGRGPIGMAIRSGKTQYVQDIGHDTAMAPWQEKAQAYGYKACIALPLIENGKPFGVLAIYAAEADAFNDEEIALLEEMAEDLSYGIHTLRVAIERDQSRTEQQQTLKQMQEGLVETVEAIAATVEMRDPYTAGHQRRVAELAVAIAGKLGLDEEQIQGIFLTGIVHDLGKIGIPAEILSYPGRLNETQFMLVRQHSQIGFDILKDVRFPWPIAQMVLQHHERLDGSGYPQGLKGDAILFGAKILAVADVLEAMSSHRPYREGLGLETALAEINDQRGTQFDAEVVDACTGLFREDGYELPV